MQTNTQLLSSCPATVLSQRGDVQTLRAIDAPIVLVCSADENYAMPMTVMLASVLANLRQKQQLLIVVLDGGIQPSTKQKIIRSLSKYKDQIRFDWLKPDHSLLQDVPLQRHLTLAAYYRLLIPEVLPANLDKVLYLDCDMIVRGDIATLWQLDVGENYVLAVQDDNQPLVSVGYALQNYQALGLQPDQKYFNSGLLVINLKKWRAETISRKVIQFSTQHHSYIENADQDGLNAVFRGHWGQLSERWNQMPRIHTYSSWQESPYDEATFKALRDTPYIIHYTNSPKPWHHSCQHPAKDLFLVYLDQTAWRGWRDTLWRRAARKARRGLRKIRKAWGTIAP